MQINALHKPYDTHRSIASTGLAVNSPNGSCVVDGPGETTAEHVESPDG